MTDLFKKGLDLLLKRQTNILSAAFVIMSTVILSQVLGLIQSRLLVSIFGPSNDLGVYYAATLLPDFLFQTVIAAAISGSFIPIFTEYITKHGKAEADKMASTLFTVVLAIFIALSIILAVAAPYLLAIMNVGKGFSPDQMLLMANLMRILLIAQFFFITGMFFTALLQTQNHFFIAGFAAALYNLGIIIGIVCFKQYGMYAPTIGNVLGAILFVLLQLPTIRKVGFRYKMKLDFYHPGVKKVFCLMWPRSLSNLIFNFSNILTVTLISFLPSAGRNYVLFDYAQTLAFAPVMLFGQTIAQAAFPILAKEKEKLDEFRATFITSFNQMLYLVLPVSVLLLVLRIPIVRLIYGASMFDWDATVLTGRTLAFFSFAIFAESLKALISRGFYALHDTKILLIVGGICTLLMLGISAFFILVYPQGILLFGKLYLKGIMSIAFAYTISSILELSILFFILDRKTGGFNKQLLFISWTKIFAATFFTAIALYLPIKLLDQLIFDTTKTINLLLLTGISSLIGLSIYLFLTWLFNVREARMYLIMFRKLGNWREILNKQPEVIENTKF